MNIKEMRKELLKINGLGNVTVDRIIGHFEKHNLLVPEPQYCYSWNGEDYSFELFDTVEDALKDAKASDDKKEVYVGQAVIPKLAWFAHEEEIILSMEENLRSECGEYAEDALDITNEMESDLSGMIDKTVQEWIDKYHIKPNCFTVIGSKLYQLN